ncbi:NrfD/PsrC family molybdoenzyme membrane anchor subunit [Halovivax sp.]|uniref:NrfD/PsrC family molybdoenzyme membrane anchor subunit n=1 Tax=Halovivax sp. TaxID=1935978 RepID=UPI0025B81168|nr:NrfD/PsrC family molybdoenzyme membrane anchor subunit [Halovivax sp.]
MSIDATTDRVLKPLRNTTKRYWLLLGALILASLWVLFAWFVQLRLGLMDATNLGDWGTSGGVPWGLYIGSFVWWIGIAHGGIAISAAVRVFKIERYVPIARIAEILTLLALSMGALSIVFSLGRPDRIFNSILQWPLTVYHSPLAWDIAVITLYLVLTLTYLTMTLQPDLAAIKHRVPRYLRPIYAVVLIGYDPAEKEKTDKMVWWLALAILALVPLLSGGVVPWLFGFIPAQPGWYGAAAGPSMLIESLATAIASVIVIVAAFRYGYGWDDMIDDEIFLELAKVLTFFVFATLFFVMHDILTGIYLAPAHIGDMTLTVVGLPFFWVAVAGLVLAAIYLLLMVVRPRFFSVPGLVATSVVVTVMVLNKKVMFIVEGLMHPSVPPITNLYPTGFYFPNWVEWSLLAGTVVFAALGFAVLSKLVPMMEIAELEENGRVHREAAVDVDESPDGDRGAVADGGEPTEAEAPDEAGDTEVTD